VIAQLRSELRKMATTRTNLGLLIGRVALILFGVIAGSFGSEADLSLAENQRELIGNGTFAAVFAALIGVMAMTSEFRHGTICATFVFTPRWCATAIAVMSFRCWALPRLAEPAGLVVVLAPKGVAPERCTPVFMYASLS
jgi:hypothetical protein